MDFEIGELVVWDTPITGETHCGSVIEYRPAQMGAMVLEQALVLPIGAGEAVTVEVANLRSLAEEASK